MLDFVLEDLFIRNLNVQLILGNLKDPYYNFLLSIVLGKSFSDHFMNKINVTGYLTDLLVLKEWLEDQYNINNNSNNNSNINLDAHGKNRTSSISRNTPINVNFEEQLFHLLRGGNIEQAINYSILNKSYLAPIIESARIVHSSGSLLSSLSLSLSSPSTSTSSPSTTIDHDNLLYYSINKKVSCIPNVWERAVLSALTGKASPHLLDVSDDWYDVLWAFTIEKLEESLRMGKECMIEEFPPLLNSSDDNLSLIKAVMERRQYPLESRLDPSNPKSLITILLLLKKDEKNKEEEDSFIKENNDNDSFPFSHFPLSFHSSCQFVIDKSAYDFIIETSLKQINSIECAFFLLSKMNGYKARALAFLFKKFEKYRVLNEAKLQQNLPYLEALRLLSHRENSIEWLLMDKMLKSDAIRFINKEMRSKILFDKRGNGNSIADAKSIILFFVNNSMDDIIEGGGEGKGGEEEEKERMFYNENENLIKEYFYWQHYINGYRMFIGDWQIMARYSVEPSQSWKEEYIQKTIRLLDLFFEYLRVDFYGSYYLDMMDGIEDGGDDGIEPREIQNIRQKLFENVIRICIHVIKDGMNMFQAKKLEKYACELVNEIKEKALSSPSFELIDGSLIQDFETIEEGMIYLEKEFKRLLGELMQIA